MIYAIAMSFVVGILSKFSDLIVDDGLKVHRYAGYGASAAYGFLLALLIHAYPVLSPLVMAVAIAVTITKKLDDLTHAIGIGSFLLFISAFGFPAVDMPFLVIFLLGGLADEIGNDFTDRRKTHGAIKTFFENRLSLEVFAFIVSLATGNWIIWLSLASFDIGYNTMTRAKPIFRRRGMI
ncbi:MAG: hypothetical protein GXO64_05055 [Candidatus Micrarchaeota archaeon]|nr:hypothetical protein [Candidatus Micrarchaeota archaeon]